MSDIPPALLDLRGTFLLPELKKQGFLRRLGYGNIAHVVPINEDHLVIHTDISVFLYVLSTQEKQWEIDCPSFNFAIDLTHSILALAPENETITLWDLQTGVLLHQLIYHPTNTESMAYRVNPNGFELSYDGSILAVGMQNDHASIVTLWDTASGSLIRVLSLEKHLDDITTLAFHPEGNILAGGSFNNHKVWFWNVDDGSLLDIWDLRLPDNNRHDRPYDLAFSPDGSSLFVCSGTCGLRIWDVEHNQEVVCPLSVDMVQPIWLAVDPGGHFLAVTHPADIGDQALLILDRRNWQIVSTFPGDFSCPFFSCDGQFLAVSSTRSELVHLIEMTTKQLLAQFQLLDFLGTPLRILSSSGDMLVEVGNDMFRIWDMHNSLLLSELAFADKGSSVSVALHPQKHIVAVSRRFGFKQFFIDLWNITDGTFLFRLEGHTGAILALDFSPDGQLLASGSADKTLRLWDLERKQEILRCEGHRLAVTDVTFAPDGDVIASSSIDKTLSLWLVENGNRLCELAGHTGEPRTLTFSPDGQTLASGEKEGRIYLWGVPEQEQKACLIGHTASVNSLSFRADGHFLASGSNDQMVYVWDTINKQKLSHLKTYQGQINNVMFTPDDQVLITSGADCIRFWHGDLLFRDTEG